MCACMFCLCVFVFLCVRSRADRAASRVCSPLFVTLFCIENARTFVFFILSIRVPFILFSGPRSYKKSLNNFRVY